MNPNKKPTRVAPSKRRVGVSEPKSSMFDVEVLSKEARAAMKQCRIRSKFSDNLVYRVHHLGVGTCLDMTNDTSSNDNGSSSSSSSSRDVDDSFVNAKNGSLISRGVIPSAVPADYVKLSNSGASAFGASMWTLTESKHCQLKDELDKLEREIANKERSIKERVDDNKQYNDIEGNNKFLQTSRVSSTFKWKSNVDKSISHADFNWSIDKLDRLYEVTNTQYGECSKTCDYMSSVNPYRKPPVRETRGRSRG